MAQRKNKPKKNDQPDIAVVPDLLGANERRRAERLQLNCRICECAVDKKHAEKLPELHDISGTGLCILYVEELIQGQKIDITLEIDSPKNKKVRVAGNVVWCKKSVKHLWSVGIAISRISNTELFVNYLAEKMFDRF